VFERVKTPRAVRYEALPKSIVVKKQKEYDRIYSKGRLVTADKFKKLCGNDQEKMKKAEYFEHTNRKGERKQYTKVYDNSSDEMYFEEGDEDAVEKQDTLADSTFANNDALDQVARETAASSLRDTDRASSITAAQLGLGLVRDVHMLSPRGGVSPVPMVKEVKGCDSGTESTDDYVETPLNQRVAIARVEIEPGKKAQRDRRAPQEKVNNTNESADAVMANVSELLGTAMNSLSCASINEVKLSTAIASLKDWLGELRTNASSMLSYMREAVVSHAYT